MYNPDFAKLAFVFGSLKVGLDTKDIKYVLDKDLNPLRVENVSFAFERYDDFDLTGGKGSEAVNHILKQVADPSGIGKKVILDFGDNATIKIGVIDKDSFDSLPRLDASDLDWKDFLKGAYFVIFKKYGLKAITMLLFFEEYKRIRETGVIDFLDESGRVVIFGNSEDYVFYKTKTQNFELSSNVDIDYKILGIDVVPDFIIAYVEDLNHYKKHLDKGIVYVGGKGYNVYNIDEKSVILDYSGNGEVIFTGIKLTGGKFNTNKNSYIGLSNEEYVLEKPNLAVSNLKITTKDKKELVIRDFNDRINKFLGIKLKKLRRASFKKLFYFRYSLILLTSEKYWPERQYQHSLELKIIYQHSLIWSYFQTQYNTQYEDETKYCVYKDEYVKGVIFNFLDHHKNYIDNGPDGNLMKELPENIDQYLSILRNNYKDASSTLYISESNDNLRTVMVINDKIFGRNFKELGSYNGYPFDIVVSFYDIDDLWTYDDGFSVFLDKTKMYKDNKEELFRVEAYLCHINISKI